jgi:hypothetical protein
MPTANVYPKEMLQTQREEEMKDLSTRVLNTLRGRVVFGNRAVPLSVIRRELVGMDEYKLTGVLKELESKGLVTIQMVDWGELGARLTNGAQC